MYDDIKESRDISAGKDELSKSTIDSLPYFIQILKNLCNLSVQTYIYQRLEIAKVIAVLNTNWDLPMNLNIFALYLLSSQPMQISNIIMYQRIIDFNNNPNISIFQYGRPL